MAIKDLFSKQKSQSADLRGASKKSVDEFKQDVESSAEIKQIRIEDFLVIPDLNYASASNFVKYGSAKKYYEDAVKRIYSQYPYDGSNKEKVAFRNNLTQLERYILDHEYPRSTGFGRFCPSGWGTNSAELLVGGFGIPDAVEHIQFKSQIAGNIYNKATNRRGNLHLNWESGSTVEFWLKKDGFPDETEQTQNEAIFQISGGLNGHSGHELELYINRASNENTLTLQYGTYVGEEFTSKFNTDIQLNKINSFADSLWHHYAVAFKQANSTTLNIKAYVDGHFDQDINVAVAGMPAAISGTLVGTLAALGDTYAENSGTLGHGKLSGSIDEFRLWKEQRTAEDIGRNYFTVINGGTNTDDEKYNTNTPVNLGVYFKFNEGKTGISTIDNVVLDYSGRISNGIWTGYTDDHRDLSSAFIQSGKGTEIGDPIIYSQHPSVLTLSSNLEASGTQHDASNVGSLQASIPTWMLDEDAVEGGEIKNLLQVLGSYLDSLHLQISQIPKFQNAEYQENNTVASNPHNRRLLTSLGFDVPELFIDEDVLESIANQDDKRKFEDKLAEIKGLVYKNIYNNLSYINKSKGTVKSIRNLLRCYGIDDDLFNFNVYANNAEYTLQDDFKNSSIKFDSLDLTPFSNIGKTAGVIYNFAEGGNDDSSPFISGSTIDNIGFTVEANAIFPKTPSTYLDTVGLTDPAIVTSSVFGVREALFTDQTTTGDNTAAHYSVRAIKEDNTAKFQVSASSGVLLESDRFYNVYDNSRWNLSVRVRYDFDEFKTQGDGVGYKLEFNGYNYDQDVLQNSFSLTDSLTAAQGDGFIAADKRIYAGAEKTDITGSLIHRANMKLLSVLAWADYLEDEELKSHARDVTSFGREEPYDNAFTFTNGTVDEIYIPRFDTLAMNLAFNQVTASNALGKFTVEDLSSGSLELTGKYSDYSKIVSIQNNAQGAGFPVSTDVKDIEFLNISTQQIPENLNTDNMIQILQNDDDLFFLDNRPVKYFFSLEASLYDTISREMLKHFAGVLDYGSMAGSPVSEYETFNKELRVARENFFTRVENQPDLEKYVNLYKFLDSAIESVLFNLMPASADASERVRTVIESHILERPGHKKHLIPGTSTTSKNGIPKGEVTTSFTTPNIPGPTINTSLPTSTLAETPSGTAADLKVITSVIKKAPVITVDKEDFTVFKIPLNLQADLKLKQFLDTYSNKRFTDASDASGTSGWYAIIAERDEGDLATTLTNSGDKRTRNSTIRTVKGTKIENISRGKAVGNVIPIALYSAQRGNQAGNVILPIIQPEEIGNTISLERKDDQIFVAQELVKNFVDFKATIDGPTISHQTIDPDKLPIRFLASGSGDFYGSLSATLVGHHLDTYYSDDLQAPMQGPFTNQHVGGYKHRHVKIAETSDRPELYKITPSGTTVVKIQNPRADDEADTYDFGIPRVKFSREELVKRLYNTRNIKSSTAKTSNAAPTILGNFEQNYQVANTSGRRENNLAFRDQGGFEVTGSESLAVSGNLDFTLPTRTLADGTSTKTVIVSRFSSPGEEATLSEGYLDVEAAEFSPYNALPYRNRIVINNLNTFLQTPSAFGGLESGSTSTASFHQIQRNRLSRATTLGTPQPDATGSSFDNGFVINNIPRKDFGYAWISSSANASTPFQMGVYGFATTATGSGNTEGIIFHEISERQHLGDGGTDDDDRTYFVSYAGTLYSGSAPIAENHYTFNDDENLLLAPENYVVNVGTAKSEIGNHFTNINGPYGFPTFKQSRTGEHPVARFLNRSNFVIAGTRPGQLRVTHAPVSSKYKPILQNIRSVEAVGGRLANKDLFLKYTYGNNYDFYGNYYDSSGSKLDNPFRERHFSIVDKEDALLNSISSLYAGDLNAIELNSMIYRETIWPKETNTYLSKVRSRPRYQFNWNDSREVRSNEPISASQGVNTETYSKWPMDTETSALSSGELMRFAVDVIHPRFGRYFLSGSGEDTALHDHGYHNITGSTPLNQVQTQAGQGPFFDNFDEWNRDLRYISKDQSILPEYRISDNIDTILEAGNDILRDSVQSLSLSGSARTLNNIEFLEQFAHSDDIPAIEIIRETQNTDATRFSLSVTATKKLLPYDGFYPLQRTMQLATLFSSSVLANASTVGANGTIQTLNNVIFSRLTYGSIRAGVATDTANWLGGKIINASDPAELNNANQVRWQRIPFEAIIDPATQISTSSITEEDLENPLTGQFSTASLGFVEVNYPLAASNFYAGVVDTFVQNSSLTSLRSKPFRQWNFGDFNSYEMDLVVSKKGNFTNHDDIAANGYPYPVHACFYQPCSNSAGHGGGNAFTWGDTTNTANSSINGTIPPAASFSENEAIVTINFDYRRFNSAAPERTPTLDDIVQYSTLRFKNKQMSEDAVAAGFGFTNAEVNSSSPFMTIEAGVDWNLVDQQGRWAPTLRWECPTHNYIDATTSFPDGTSGGTGFALGDVARGVWHQFSNDTKSGLKMFARGPSGIFARDTGSLASAVGFAQEHQAVSQLAASADLKEYIVAIPFVTNECSEEVFFHYPIDTFEAAYANLGKSRVGSLTEMLSKQREIILPPKLNYMAKRDSTTRRLEQDDYNPILPPFAMYIFEITETLTKDDLSKWWQGVLPEAGKRAQLERFNISHDIEEGQIISPSVLNNDLFEGVLPKEMRFKIFKAKYKRNLTYDGLKEQSVNGTPQNNSVIGYNYPHDFYSLVETAKVDLELEYFPSKTRPAPITRPPKTRPAPITRAPKTRPAPVTRQKTRPAPVTRQKTRPAPITRPEEPTTERPQAETSVFQAAGLPTSVIDPLLTRTAPTTRQDDNEDEG